MKTPTLKDALVELEVNMDANEFVIIFNNKDEEGFSVLVCGRPETIDDFTKRLNERVDYMKEAVGFVKDTENSGTVQ